MAALDIEIPSDLLPRDGRFCVGPSVVRHEALEALAAEADPQSAAVLEYASRVLRLLTCPTTERAG